MKYAVVIVAAGSGSRMGLGFNKVYARLKDGRTILETTVSVFENDPDCEEIVVVTDSDLYREKIDDTPEGKLVLAEGGDSRQASVRNGLDAVISPYVMVHDGARPFLSKDCLDRLKEALETHDAALLGVPCKDTVKHVENGRVIETYERSTLLAAQTPQAFKTELLRECMAKAEAEGYLGTDDCSLVERYGNTPVIAVEGSYDNYKITTPEDIR
ncbi:MAG: 2-C-methyl-D-erythritol 4-phosphate cytidylyltransferase [Solobacterium sp.]|nr:2-C-methyl-D-erythritol 4-phosphate cytidylyltransferase [Solobacterium sp.]